jgi:DNA (cytosine-5)-methyltransferase 1
MTAAAAPRLLDLFCCQGGAGEGYRRAGFDVTGVDIEPQPRNPHRFIQGDALEFLAAHCHEFDAIHASPPCQAFSLATHFHGTQGNHLDLIEPTRALLTKIGVPWVIENVDRAPVRRDLVLCGEMFGLRVHRHRLFETGGWLAMCPPHQPHNLKGAIHNCHIEDGHARQVAGNFADLADASDAMGIDWMDRHGLAQAIPPAYTEFIGQQLMAHITTPLLERAA